MRHRFNSSYSCLTCRHEHVEKPYFWREWTFTRRSSKTRLAQVLQYLVDHPGATRRQLHEAVFKQKFNPGQHSNFYSNALWHDFIDYDKHFKYVVIDTINGLMVAEEMRILSMQGGDKRSAWTDLASNGWEVVNKSLEMRDDLTVIILAHSETISDENGIVKTRIKTNGRKLEKLVLESKMTTVVWAVRQDGEYKFILSADGSTCKVPLGAFDKDEIENDITLVIKALEDF